MSKEKTLRISEETEVMQAAGVPAQETEGVGAAMATEIIADLKEQLQEAKEEAKAVTEDWMFVRGKREILGKKVDSLNFLLKFHDYKVVKGPKNFVRAAYNQQPPEENEQEGAE